MMKIHKMLLISLAAALALTGVVSGVRGQAPGGGSSFGGSGRGMVVVTGRVMCAQCSLEDVRKAQPNEYHLYQLSYRRNQLVLKVTAVDNAAMFESLAWPPQLAVRGPDSLLSKLSAEENLFKEMTITGLLHNTRTLDVFDIAITG
jgi:hypothetical protein